MYNKKGYMYILECANGQYYVGSTSDLELRLMQHQGAQVADYLQVRRGSYFTKLHLPIKLVYKEEFPTIQQAFNREQQVKKWTRAKKEALIKGNIELLVQLSKSK
ncbi:MAG: GIY-YIG nuclease family protein [Bacteroidales bacterium]|nr:GIY-YIG nuclease family protein [Bacteroidales bacterium]